MPFSFSVDIVTVITELWVKSPYYRVRLKKETRQNYRETSVEKQEFPAIKMILGCLLSIGTEIVMEIAVHLGRVYSCYTPSTSLKHLRSRSSGHTEQVSRAPSDEVQSLQPEPP